LRDTISGVVRSSHCRVCVEGVQHGRGRPMNAPAAFIHPCQPMSPSAELEARRPSKIFSARWSRSDRRAAPRRLGPSDPCRRSRRRPNINKPMTDPALIHERLPHDPPLNSRLQSSSQTYRLTIRARPGTDPIRALRTTLKALKRYHGWDVTEIVPFEGKDRPRTKAAVKRRERYIETSYYKFFGENPDLED
jgi:hypothetical protein